MPRIADNPFLVSSVLHLPPFGLPYEVVAMLTGQQHFTIRPTACALHANAMARSAILRDLLLCCGIMSTPAATSSEARAWGFLVEHYESLRPTPGILRAVRDVETWPTRVRQLFGERLGLGLAAWVLWRDFDVIHIADAGPFIGAAAVQRNDAFNLVTLALVGTYGEVEPDFLCLDSSLRAVVAESKGTVGATRTSAGERRKAKQQVANVEPIGVTCRPQDARLVLDAWVRYEHSVPNANKDTTVYVTDPEPKDPVKVRVNPDLLVAYAYAKFVAFAGYRSLARALLTEVRPLPLPFLRSVVGNEPIRHLLFPAGLALLESVAKTLFFEPLDGLAERVATALAASELASQPFTNEQFTALPNGGSPRCRLHTRGGVMPHRTLPGHIPRVRTPLEAASIEALTAFCNRSLVGFVSEDGRRGSGTLLELANDIVVVTAGHVVRALRDEPQTRMEIVGDGGTPVVVSPFTAGFRFTLLPNADVGVIKLLPEAARNATPFALSVSSLLEHGRPVDAFLTEHQQVQGFPASLGNDHLRVNTVVQHPCPHPHPDGPEHELVPEHGIHVDWSGHMTTSGVGANPYPPGMSGGPLWTALRDPDGIWSPSKNAKLAGIVFFGDMPNCMRAESIDAWREFASTVDEEWRLALGLPLP